MSQLSEHDKAVLNCVLYPNLPFSDTLGPIELKDDEELTTEIKQTQEMEISAIKLAESGDLQEALSLLNQALTIAPNRASIYNNRAQVYQFQKKDEGKKFQLNIKIYKKNIIEAFSDLTKAINLAKMSQVKTLSQALCQRGLLYRKSSKFDEARQDFEKAAKLGNHFAKSQVKKAICQSKFESLAPVRAHLYKYLFFF